MTLITSSYVYDFIIFLLTLTVAVTVYVKNRYGYWKKRGIPQLDPCFPLGNYPKFLPRGISFGAFTKNYYNKFKKMGSKLGGVYLGLDPYLVIVDPSYAKDILTKDFQYFSDRGLYFNKNFPITVNILSQETNEWRTTRTKFTSFFTSSKMKFIFETLKACSEDLRKYLAKLVDTGEDVDIFETIACFTTDVISSVIYGIEANSFREKDAIFRKMGRELFNKFTMVNQLELFLCILFPNIARKFGVTNIQPRIEKFIMEFSKEALTYREKNKIYRPDFLQLLIELKQSGITFSDEEIASQAFIFFSAGFETSSASTSFTLLELGLHQDIQDKVREEIHTVLKKYNGDVTYESLNEMTYLSQVFSESARKYPLLTTLNRVCVKDYKFKDSDVTIEKGTNIILPVLGYHRDPDYYPDPLNYDPDRFQDKNEKHEGFLPFGDGPRNCIGSRFGLVQVRLGLVSVLRDYRVHVSPKTILPLELDEQTFVTRTTNPIYLKLEKL